MRSLATISLFVLVGLVNENAEAQGGTWATKPEAFAACNAYVNSVPPSQENAHICDRYCEEFDAPPGALYEGSFLSRVLQVGLPIGGGEPNCDHAAIHVPYVYTFLWTSPFDCPAGGGQYSGSQSFHTSLEPPPVCKDDLCEYEPTTGSCSDDGTGGYWCLYTLDGNGQECNTPGDDGIPEDCVFNEITGVVSCSCTIDPAAPYCQDPPDPEDPVPPNCIESGSVMICDDWPQQPAPPPGTDPPDGCYVSGSVMYCPPGGDTPDPDDPTDTGTPGSPDQPGDGGTPGQGDPGGGEQEPGCTGSECEPDNSSASTTGSCGDGPPACAGDAIQCAILVQSWRNTCAPFDLEGNNPPWEDDPDWGRDLKGEAEPLYVGGEIDGGGPGGSCPANVSWSAFGQSFEIDMQPMCDLASVLRIFVLAIAWLQAAWLFTRAF